MAKHKKMNILLFLSPEISKTKTSAVLWVCLSNESAVLPCEMLVRAFSQGAKKHETLRERYDGDARSSSWTLVSLKNEKDVIEDDWLKLLQSVTCLRLGEESDVKEGEEDDEEEDDEEEDLKGNTGAVSLILTTFLFNWYNWLSRFSWHLKR